MHFLTKAYDFRIGGNLSFAEVLSTSVVEVKGSFAKNLLNSPTKRLSNLGAHRKYNRLLLLVIRAYRRSPT